MPPTAPGPVIPAYTGTSPTAPGAAVAVPSGSNPTAPGAAVAVPSGSDPTRPGSAVDTVPQALVFRPCFVPELPNGGHLLQVPEREEYSRPIYTSTGRSADALDSLVLLPEAPVTGIWCACYYNGTVWRFDVRYGDELMFYYSSATSAFTNPAAVPVWDFSDNPGVYPSDEWNSAELSRFTMVMTDSGCLLVPIYLPNLGNDELKLMGNVEGRPFYASGEGLYWNGESWQGWDVAMVWTSDPGLWQFGELGSGPTWEFSERGYGPPIGVIQSGITGEAIGNLKLLPAPPSSPSAAIPAHTPGSPTAPGGAV